MKRIMIISTTVAFCGALGTMVAATSCDPECTSDRRTGVYLHLTGQEAWDPAEHPARVRYTVHPLPGARADPTSFEGTFGADPAFRPGRCLDDGCSDYALGFDEPGTYEIRAEICGKTFETSVEVGLSEDACHIEPVDVALPVDASACDEGVGPIEPAPIDRCDKMAHPSVYVAVGNTVDDVFMPIDVDRVWYSVIDHDAPTPDPPHEFQGEGQPAPCYDEIDDVDDPRPNSPDPEPEVPLEATCIENPHGPGCMAWLAGFERTGWFTVGVEYCGVTIEETVWVGRESADACHIDTRFVMLEVETRECLGTPTRTDPEPPASPDPRIDFG